MGSPLAPVLANFFMCHYEKLWLNNYAGPKVLYCEVCTTSFPGSLIDPGNEVEVCLKLFIFVLRL